ncbi:MAG: hypothetical protein FWE88_00285 [Phycisphaerae bacterium]|nr:hypothetical protein [Phycisphaerae bacterium]
MTTTISTVDRNVIRDLARRVADVAAMPIQRQRVDAWKRHNALRGERPLILLFPEGAWRELLPEETLLCEHADARGIEYALRIRLYEHEHFRQDKPIEADWPVQKHVRSTGWGLEAQWHYADEATGARTFNPILHTAADLKKIQAPQLTVDEASSRAALEFAQGLFGDLLTVRPVGVTHISFHAMNWYTGWRGLEQTMMDMYENPGMLHEAMAIMQAGYESMLRQYEQLGLLTLNNDATYHNSGGVSYSDELPQKDFTGTVRLCDMWASAETQEFAQVSPEMHAEFALQYEKPLLAKFGLNGYGCCEDLTRKLDDVLTIPNIRRVSISPWADVDRCAAQLKNQAIFSWKPHPAQVAGGFHPEAVRDNIRHTIDVCKQNGCTLEMILKDTHTCDGQTDRFDQWTKIAEEEIARAYP